MMLNKKYFADLEMPSNRNFGFFFSFVFLVASLFCYKSSIDLAFYVFGCSGLLLLGISFAQADLLRPLNKMWMSLGLLLGMFVSPIVLGIIFFALFTPIAFVTRFAGRDELRLRFGEQTSHWIRRETAGQIYSFKHQF